MVTDNVLAGDSVVDRGAKPKRYTEFMKTFSETRANHPQLETLLIPIGDGLTISKVKKLVWSTRCSSNFEWHRKLMPCIKRILAKYYIIMGEYGSEGRGQFTMTTSEKSLRICSNRHEYFKSSDCPVCPKCEQERKPINDFLAKLSSPARRALEHHGITTLQQLSTFSEKEILRFHGIGPASLPILRASLEESSFSFKQ